MDVQGRQKLLLIGAVAAVAIGLGCFVVLRRGDPGTRPIPAPTSGTPAPPANAPDPAPPPPPPPAPPRPVSTPTDPLLRHWVLSIRGRQRQGVESAQAALLAKESEYREALVALARDDADPRIRAFTVGLLSRMKAPPPEEFFIDRLADPEEYPRTSALSALERLGGGACLPAVDRLAASDPVPGVRAAAAQASKVVRAR